MGDPAGVGPEVCARVLASASGVQSNPWGQHPARPIVFGDADVLTRVGAKLGLPPIDEVVDWEFFTAASKANVVHVPGLELKDFQPGKVNANTGLASFQFIESAIAAALDGRVDAVTTGPINKEAWQAAGISFPGHTEQFADRCQTDRFCMMMTAPSFSCSLVTTHVGYHEVPELLATDRILEVIELTAASLERIVGRPPRLLVLGLNPHAGEAGLFGRREEERLIEPAVSQAASRGLLIEGPLPPDTAFLPWRREQTDGYICMYHDQGLIPFKALNFDTGVNITLGLPLIRTSVDHGTALDIAWQGTADCASLRSAIALAAKLANG